MGSAITQERPSFYPEFALCDSTRDNVGHYAGLTLIPDTNDRSKDKPNSHRLSRRYAKLTLAIFSALLDTRVFKSSQT
jgi:hypothetical protein